MEIFFGTRPEWLKAKPLLSELERAGIQYSLTFTGQHTDLVLKELPKDKIINIINITSNNPNRLKAINISLMEYEIKSEWVMIIGDTTSAFAIAKNAFYSGKKIIHLEAGLRTRKKNSPFPEEVERRNISDLANIHLCPTNLNRLNLVQESQDGNIYVVGNTSLDNLRELGISDGNKIIITMHRREMFPKIKEWFAEIENLANLHPKYDFRFYAHPNPNVQKHLYLFNKVNVFNSIPHNEMLKEISECFMIIGDSGGLQEESSYLGKKMIVCREFTERPEALGLTSYLCENPERLVSIFNLISKFSKIESRRSPFGDGYAAEKIVKILKEEGI